MGAFLLLLTRPTKSLAQPLPEEKVYRLWMPIVIARQEEMSEGDTGIEAGNERGKKRMFLDTVEDNRMDKKKMTEDKKCQNL